MTKLQVIPYNLVTLYFYTTYAERYNFVPQWFSPLCSISHREKAIKLREKLHRITGRLETDFAVPISKS